MKGKQEIVLVGLLAGLVMQAWAFSHRLEVSNTRKENISQKPAAVSYSKSHSGDVTVTSSRRNRRRATLQEESSLSPEEIDEEDVTTTKVSSVVPNVANLNVLSAEGQALKDDIKVEYGEGHGETFDEALKEAMKDVLQKVVGVYVNSDFRMNNDEIIKDEIITHSNGFIDHYKKMDESDDASGRGKIVTIRAWVKIRDFVNRMKEIGPLQKINIDGTLIDTCLDNDINAEVLLRKELGTIDPASLFEIRLLEASRPEVVAVNDDVVTMRYLYEVQYSNEKYYKGFLPRLKSVLNQIAVKKDFNETLTFFGAKIGMYPRLISSVSESNEKESWKDHPQTAYIYVAPNRSAVTYPKQHKKTVAVVDKVNKGGVAMIARWKLSDRHMSVFCDSINKFVSKQERLRCVFSLFDENNNTVSRVAASVDKEALFMRFWDEESMIPDFMPLLPNSGIWYCAMSSESLDKVHKARWGLKSGSYFDAADRFVGYVDINVDRADIKKIKSAEIKLETNNEGENE